MSRIPTVFHFSGGKDSAQALGRLLEDPAYEVVRLVTTTSRATGRSTVHGTPPVVLQAQAERIGLPLEILELPGSDLDGYLTSMAKHARALVTEGVKAVAFGDLSASGARSLKDDQFGPFGLEVVEPLLGPELSGRDDRAVCQRHRGPVRGGRCVRAGTGGPVAAD